jgi:hypothetical protein
MAAVPQVQRIVREHPVKDLNTLFEVYNAMGRWPRFHNPFERAMFNGVEYAFITVSPGFSPYMATLIGKGGVFFKKLTVQSGVYEIWHDRTQNTIQIFGPSVQAIAKCEKLLYDRIHYLVTKKLTVLAPIKKPKANVRRPRAPPARR